MHRRPLQPAAYEASSYLDSPLVVRYSSSFEANKKRNTMSLARAELESLLRTRQLDRTLTTTLPPGDETTVAATGIGALDALLGGGLPRGHLSEIVGPRSS